MQAHAHSKAFYDTSRYTEVSWHQPSRHSSSNECDPNSPLTEPLQISCLHLILSSVWYLVELFGNALLLQQQYHLRGRNSDPGVSHTSVEPAVQVITTFLVYHEYHVIC